MKLICVLITCYLSCVTLTSCQQSVGAPPEKPAGFNPEGGISKGMSKEAVRVAWGKPNQVRRLNTGKELWIYKRPADRYLDFPTNLIARETSARFDDKFLRGSSISHERIDALAVYRTVVFGNGKVEAWTQLRD